MDAFKNLQGGIMKNITWHAGKITKNDRRAIKNQRSFILWFTGLPASGKSTLAMELDHALWKKGLHTYVLDGDNIRHGLNQNLGFSPEDRKENIRRVGEVAKLFVDAGIIVLTAFISPYREDRDRVRKLVEPGEFYEIYVECPLEVCMERDPKGLYQKAVKGEIPNFTGVSAPYEPPLHPELVVHTAQMDVVTSVAFIMKYLEQKNLLRRQYA